ncbi:MAG: TIGR01212 family radical SAM protein [Lentisphaeria bacterium]|nr:TIGR01212 family radical SAM protein [Lentisphaeria bacterium]
MNDLIFFSDSIKQQFGQKLYRIPIDLHLGCPNRVDNFGQGCIFCSADGAKARHLSRCNGDDLPQQVTAGKKYIFERYHSSGPYMAYFQAFTSTNAPAVHLQKLYDTVLREADFKVLIISTRPDALNDEIYAMLQELNQKYQLWIELGIQSANDKTLQLINRGHDFAAVQQAVEALAVRNIRCAGHLILGLPGEKEADFLTTARKVAALPLAAYKFHQLMVCRNTPLSSCYQTMVKQQQLHLLNEYEYAKQLKKFLKLLPDGKLIMRLTGDADPNELLAPRWNMSKGDFLTFFQKYFYADDDNIAITTGDGSKTLYNARYKQNFHSIAGAASEAKYKFVIPTHLEKRLVQHSAAPPLQLLDIGFGLGYNCMSAIEAAQNTNTRIEIISLENDPAVIAQALSAGIGGLSQRKLLTDFATSQFSYAEHYRATLMLDDARKSVKELHSQGRKFDVIFMDGFSVECNVQLWTYDFIRILKNLLTSNGIIATYSSANQVRGAFLRAGLLVGESAPFGRKRGGTLGAMEPESIELPLPEKELNIILHSVAGTPYRDASLCDSATQIQQRHAKLVDKLRRQGVPKWFKK